MQTKWPWIATTYVNQLGTTRDCILMDGTFGIFSRIWGILTTRSFPATNKLPMIKTVIGRTGQNVAISVMWLCPLITVFTPCLESTGADFNYTFAWMHFLQAQLEPATQV